MDRRQYLKHFAVLFTGAAAAQLVNLVSYPILARIYSPADFGIFATFVAAAAIPGALACARFDLAVPIAPRWGRFAILWLCTAICGAMGVASGLVSAGYWWIAEGRLNPVLPVLFGLCVFLTGFCTAASLYLMRHDHYRVSSTSIVSRTGATVAVQLILGLLWTNSLSLITGFIAGLAAQASILAWTIWSRVPPGRPSTLRMRALFKRYRHQVSVDVPSTLLAALSLNLLTFLLAFLYGQAVVGFYALAQRIAILPLQLFNDALGQVFFQKAARAQEERGHFWPEMRLNLQTSVPIAFALLVALWLFARPLVTFYLGREWAPAATMLVILAPMLAARSVAQSIATTVFVLDRAHWRLIHNLLGLALYGATFAIAIMMQLGVYEYLTLVSIALGVEWTLFALVLVNASRRRRLSSRLPA